MRRDPRKDLYRRERDSLKGPHDEVEIQRKALGRGKNLALSKDTCLEKERVRSKVTLRKVGVKLERRRESNKSRMGWRLAWWGSTEKKEALHLLGLRGRHQCSDQRFNRNRAACVASTTVGTGGEEDLMARSSYIADGRRHRSREIINEERGPRTDPCGTPRRTRKERLL